MSSLLYRDDAVGGIDFDEVSGPDQIQRVFVGQTDRGNVGHDDALYRGMIRLFDHHDGLGLALKMGK